MDNWVLNQPLDFWPTYTEKNYKILFRFFEPQKTVVVLSSSNEAEKEVVTHLCESAKIPILKRKGGGGTVVLGPGCVVLTLAFYAADLFSNQTYFLHINDLWIRALQEITPVLLTQKGISDIVCGDRKVAGTSIFRKKYLLVYQGSLLVDPDTTLMHHLLKHPSREPDYRKGRPHGDFVTNLRELGCQHTCKNIMEHCHRFFQMYAGDAFGGLIGSPAKNF